MGSKAILRGLQARPELNGSDVLLIVFLEDRGRWGVRCVDGSQISVSKRLQLCVHICDLTSTMANLYITNHR